MVVQLLCFSGKILRTIKYKEQYYNILREEMPEVVDLFAAWVKTTWQSEEQPLLQNCIVPHARTLRKAREQVKWMVKDGVSPRRIINYLHRWCTWWVRTSINWLYQDILLWFLGSCWDEHVAAYATRLLHQHTAKSIIFDNFGVDYPRISDPQVAI